MNNLYVESIVEQIYMNLTGALSKIRHTEKKIAIYEMDDFSFAIQSLLKNKDMTTEIYISLNRIVVMEGKRRLNGFSTRYLRKNSDLISIEHIDDVDSSNIILLSASKMNQDDMNYIESRGFLENENFFRLYDWGKDEFSVFVDKKRKITSLEMQKIEKEILKEFDRYCLENKLRYWVCGGTLLGTIRHKGFIPWDDDIDVFMPWEDYKKFVHGYKDNERYKVASLDKEYYCDKYKTIWGKMVENTTIMREDDTVMREIHPAWIDIFPLIGLPTDAEQRRNVFKRELELERRFTELFYKGNGSIRQRNTVYEDVVKLYGEVDFDKAEYVGVMGTKYREKDCTTRGVYSETLRMPFEDIEVNVPLGYQEYLDNLYGTDWMVIPEKSKRISHALEAYWI